MTHFYSLIAKFSIFISGQCLTFQIMMHLLNPIVLHFAAYFCLLFQLEGQICVTGCISSMLMSHSALQCLPVCNSYLSSSLDFSVHVLGLLTCFKCKKLVPSNYNSELIPRILVV